MLYITLNSRKIRSILVWIAAIALLTMLFCVWALIAHDAANNSSINSVSGSDIPATLSPSQPPVFTVTRPADSLNIEMIPSEGNQEDPAVPADVNLYPSPVSRSICLPVEKAYISSPFGYRDHPVNGEYSFHNGLDLAAAEGSDIRAIMDGKVITAGFASDYGNYVIIDHGSFHSLYAHCLTLCVSEGDEVTTGQKIAQVGSTGRATGSHLHIEIRRNGQRCDPADLLGDSYS